MAYIEDLNAPSRRRPMFGGAQQPPTPDVNVTYGGQSPVNPDGTGPNPDYNGNTGIRPPRIPPVVTPPPPGGGQQGAGGGATSGTTSGTAQPRPNTPPPSPQGQTTNYAQALDALYKKYFYRAPTPGELQAHIGNLTTPNMGTLRDIEAELMREAARLQLKPPPTAAPNQPASQAPAGFDPAKWASDHNSPKYSFGRAASMFDIRTSEGLQQMWAWLQANDPRFAGARLEGDTISGLTHPDFEGFDSFDVFTDYESAPGVVGQRGIAWQPLSLNGQPWTGGIAAQASGGATGGAGSAGSAGAPGASAGAGGGVTTGQAPGLGGGGGLDFGISGEYGYDDPSTQQLEEFLRMLIDEKVKPIEDPARNQFAQQMQDAIATLTNPALTENDRSRLENRALEPMERDRQAAIQRETERLAAMGHGRGSGTYIEAIDRINRQFDERRGVVQRDLSIYDREQNNARRTESLSIGQALSNLSGQQRGEQDARMREALTYVSLFPEMDERRLRLAMETLGMSNSMAGAPSIFNTLSNLQAQANAAAQQGQQSNAAFWGQMGQWMAQNWGTTKPSGGG